MSSAGRQVMLTEKEPEHTDGINVPKFCQGLSPDAETNSVDGT